MFPSKAMTDLVAIVGSARRGGNTDLLVSAAIAGARLAGARCRRVRLHEISMLHCAGCMRCTAGRCVSRRDGVAGILEDMRRARALLFATPVYFWNVSGLMKTFWDRMLPLAGLDLRKRPVTMKPLLSGVRAGYIVVQEEPLGGQVSIPGLFFERNFSDFGMVHVGAVYAASGVGKGAIRKDRLAMDSARDLGKALVEG